MPLESAVVVALERPLKVISVPTPELDGLIVPEMVDVLAAWAADVESVCRKKRRKREIIRFIGSKPPTNRGPTAVVTLDRNTLLASKKAVILHPSHVYATWGRIFIRATADFSAPLRNDKQRGKMLRKSGRELNQTVLMITHNPEAAQIADRILHMRDGEITHIEDGSGRGAPFKRVQSMRSLGAGYGVGTCWDSAQVKGFIVREVGVPEGTDAFSPSRIGKILAADGRRKVVGR